MKEEKKSISKRYLILLLFAQVFLGLPYLDRIPRVYVDEAWDSALAYNIAEKGDLCHPFVERFGGINVHFIQNRVILPITSALIFKFTECTVFTSRLGSVLFATLAICSLFVLMSRWFGNRLAFCICLATMVHPWFFEVSRRARPEIHYTALGIVLLLFLASYFTSGSRLTAFFSGITGGILALTHPNGVIILFCVGISSLFWLRSKSLAKIFLWGSIGFVVVLLPFFVYLIHALQHPEVSFTAQMQTSYLCGSFIMKELSRWKNFFDFPKLLPLGILMFISFIAAWTDSKRQAKLLASIIFLYCIILPFVSVNPCARYIAAIIPFSTALIVRLIWRLANWTYSFRCRLRPGLVLAACIVVTYIGISTAQIGNMLFSLRNADFDRIVDKIAETVKPTDRVHADPIFWYGRDKFIYGPYIITYEGMSLKDCIRWSREYEFGYVVRTSWSVCPPFWSEKPARKMPGFRKDLVGDHLCRLFGTKVSEFYDPYYGPIEIYSLDWTKRSHLWSVKDASEQ